MERNFIQRKLQDRRAERGLWESEIISLDNDFKVKVVISNQIILLGVYPGEMKTMYTHKNQHRDDV